MAWSRNSVEDVEYVAAALISAGKKLESVAAAMRKENYLTIYLQLTSARTYADAARKLAGESEFHFDNQLYCSRQGGIPIWQQRQAKSAYNKALAESKGTKELLKKPTKKAAKKKTPRRKA